MINKIIVTSLVLSSFILNNAMQQQLTIIHSFLTNSASLIALKKRMDKIEKQNLGYPDYSKRTGLIWTDFFVETKHPEIVREYNTVKLIEVSGILKRHTPESMFSYPEIQSIVSKEILPKMFQVIEAKKWTILPYEVFAQLFIQRCHTSEPMDWHQDPGEDYTIMADYSLLLMLSNQNDPECGWSGGEFKIKPGLPTEVCLEENIQTIIPQYNQAILFNNKLHSHAVTAVVAQLLKTKRDLLVVPIYFDKIPKPVQEQ